MQRALLFDLDETLVVEEPAAVAAFEATARLAAARAGVDAAELAVAARSCARELWYAAPTHPYCRRIGISSWEGLWCRFEGEAPELRALRAWAPRYRREAWGIALARQGVEDPGLAEDLGERFGVERRARHEVFADVEATLSELGRSYRLALVTNGAACLQREKLGASGLAHHFDAVVVSGEIGAGKPDPAAFERALEELDADRERAVMIGDSHDRDVEGARAAGLGAVWLNRFGQARPAGSSAVEISTLRDLPAALGT